MQQFSIIIPSWNNLEHLKLCIESVRKNSHFQHQVIVFVNDGSDGTLEWVNAQGDIDFLHATKNAGICVAVNSCRSLVTAPYIVYMNDDMYACPNWDLELQRRIEQLGHDKFMLSATLIEPRPVNNPSYVSIVRDYGDTVKGFRESALLASLDSLPKEDWSGASWPPSVVSTRVWDIVGGYSIEFSPGMYSDPDFSMKLWKYGVREFIGVGSSKVYHFQSKSTNKVKKNDGNLMFLMKWGLTAKTFYGHYLKMGKPYHGAMADDPSVPAPVRTKNRLKKMFKTLLGK